MKQKTQRLSLLFLAGLLFNCGELKQDETEGVGAVKDEIIYGKWCGPLYSGPEDPDDDLDTCCQTHDQCYDGINGGVNYLQCNKGEKQTCDRAFVVCVQALPDDVDEWTSPPANSTDAVDYQSNALAVFQACSGFEDLF